jgi:hypothetical protein
MICRRSINLVVIIGILIVVSILVKSAADSRLPKTIIKESTVSLLRKNKLIINQIASKYNLSPVAIAGVVTAEQNLNINYIDSMQNVLLKSWLVEHDEQWWFKWAESNERLAYKADDLRARSNKWPIELIMSGYVMSYGPAQITPRTLLRACNSHKIKPMLCKGTTKEIVADLLTEEPSTLFEIVAIVLDYDASQWERRNKDKNDIRNNIGALGTMYSMGSDYYYRKYKKYNNTIINNFGRWILVNQGPLEDVLQLQSWNFGDGDVVSICAFMSLMSGMSCKAGEIV